MPTPPRPLLLALLLGVTPSLVTAQDAGERLTRRLPALMDSAGIAGVSVALLEGDVVRWSAGFGTSERPAGAPVDTLTVFEAASLTKPVVAAGVLRMAARGEIELDRPLHDVLPHPDLTDDVRARRITARMVLSHTTGLPNWRRGQPLRTRFEPGTQYGYSGEGFVWLQRVVEHLSGLSLAEWAREEVFQPAGMRHSSLIWEDRFANKIALPHNELGRAQRKARPDSANAAASLHTTATDYARFLTALHGGMLVDQATWRALITPQVRLSSEIAWGLGIALQTTAQGVAVWHWGDNGGYKNFMLYFPERGDGLVYLSNSDAGMSIVHAVLSEVFGSNQPAERHIDYEHHDSPRRIARLAMDSAMIAGGPGLGVPRYHELRRQLAPDAFDAMLLDRIGRRVLNAGFVDDAIAVLELNVREYPDDARTHASLGEAYARARRDAEAIAELERALALDAENAAARARLTELRGR